MKGRNISFGAAFIKVADIASAVTGLIAEHSDLTIILCFEEAILTISITLGDKSHPVFEILAPVIKYQAVFKLIGDRKEAVRIAVRFFDANGGAAHSTN